jgi:hypothetical protein
MGDRFLQEKSVPIVHLFQADSETNTFSFRFSGHKAV